MIIRSFGHALPKRIVTNDELARFLDTSDEWIQSHTGIQSRRVLTGGETLSALGAQAAEMALERAGMTAADIETVLKIEYTIQANMIIITENRIALTSIENFSRTLVKMISVSSARLLRVLRSSRFLALPAFF